ncbi:MULTISPECIES: O-antigen ligase family protein [Rhodomicrobium]|uniref:O-antigen ligase family protein n=1 Tax=Rhodomicrobium TaxID=1068 RepID=UPI000B4ACE1A|nr:MULTISPECIES: O-antigen ligase family protein [Rhodomicrobium]
MSDAASTAGYPPLPPPAPARARRRRWTIVLSRKTVTDFACIIFILWASTGLRPLLPGFFANERFLWIIADVIVVAWLLLLPGQVLAITRNNRILIAWGGLACLSMIWSLSSSQSLYFGLQLMFTILMGFLLCAWTTRTRLIQIIFLGLLPTQLISFLVLFVMPSLTVGFAGGGAFTHKNVLGSYMLLQLITSLCLLLQGWRPMLTASAFLAACVLIVLSGSASSLLIAVLVVGGIVPLAMLYRSNANLTLAILGAGIITAAAFAIVLLTTDFNPVESVLGSVGKDATLTGRTVLWLFGWEAFMDRPWFGFGYRGYWSSEQSTMLLLRYVMQQDLEIFHNNFVEVAVAFGIWGPLLLVAGLVVGIRRSFMEFLRTKSISTLWALLFFLFVITYAFAENPLFANHQLLQVLFVVAMAARDPTPPRSAIGEVSPERN